MRKIIEKDTLKKALFSFAVAFVGGAWVHECYNIATVEEIQGQGLLFWCTCFLIWGAFWVGWVTKEYWVSKEQDKDRE
jgi:hypothetical protein